MVLVEQTELPVLEEEKPLTIRTKKNEQGLTFIVDLLENIRRESISDERPNK